MFIRLRINVALRDQPPFEPGLPKGLRTDDCIIASKKHEKVLIDYNDNSKLLART